ncbi:molybdopterin-synthase adenylyltransferase MoeB [Fibrobacter sp. UBA4309]|uniref:molybdopterin-synthase adenylyltransferase MoeB n=1 Tax=Fibrobacter sp. UBA4309 TaxID=1946537 RepID=UPI0025C4A46F|nr:molybdopterin-synthase adenylyltransferase MoeB [Fibrobacter sp. UBA4309]
MKIYISATLRKFFASTAQIEIPASTPRKALAILLDMYPDAKKILYDEKNSIRSFIRIYINGDNSSIDVLWDSVLPEETEILLLPAIAGGAPENAPVESLITDDRRKAVSFDDSEIERFGKHLMLKEIGVKGQKRIRAAKVVVAGAGALGSPVIQYLAAAGVGTIKVIDFDEVSLSNLQSQVLYGNRDVKRPKVASARDKVKNIDKNIVFEGEKLKLDADNIANQIDGYDLVIDCTDNYKARYLINDACALIGIPLVFGAIYQYEGQVGIFNLNGGPCYRCQFPSPPPAGLIPSCSEGGSISPLPGIIGSIQANEALKLILGIGEHLNGKILTVDSLYLQSRILKVHRNGNCPICGNHPTITQVENFDYEEFCGLKENENAAPIEGFTPEELAKRIDNDDPITIVDVREPHERAILRFPKAIVIPIGQLARRQGELDPNKDVIFVCKEGKRSILAINTLREAGYKGPLYNLKGGIDAMKDLIFSHEGAWL